MSIANINPYLVGILHKKGIKKQFIFNKQELHSVGTFDPLGEKKIMVAVGLLHRYPDRAVLLATNRCFAYCRFCFRKYNLKNYNKPDLNGIIKYLSSNKQIREIIISGGDPFTLTDTELQNILSAIKQIKHVQVIRVGTRVLSVYPERISNKTVEMLKKYKPIWLAIHVNHPDEITDEFARSAGLIINSGIPITSQTVLLKGINDDPIVLKRLFCNLVKLMIKPYYLFGCDNAKGNDKFRVSIEQALNIMKKLRGDISGLCLPTFAFDLPNGGGKVVLEPNNIVNKKENVYRIENFEGKVFTYEDV